MSRSAPASGALAGMRVGGFSDNARPAPADAPATGEEKATVKVRTIRPHDTTEGLKAPGDEYLRAAADAKALADAGVVEIVQAAPAKAKAKRAKASK